MSFPEDFRWGVATSSYQIEGAVRADGRGPSIWDTFCATPGKVKQGHTGDVACDHYHRYPEDIALMQRLGVDAYRFSIAWPRVLPDAERLEPRGLDFYDRLVDALLAAGIEPWATLYHWDLPQALEDRGGWPERATVYAFARYVEAVTHRLGDRVKHWITINEPWVASVLGYRTGEHAPGRRSAADAAAASHHLLLAHGMAVPIVRANSEGAKVGITLNLTEVVPASASAADAEVARRVDGDLNRWFLDPLHGRGYPVDVRHDLDLPEPWPVVEPGDLHQIAVRTDFLGVNYYNRWLARSDAPGNLPQSAPVVPVTDFGWDITPDCLPRLLHRLAREWGVGNLYITENGASFGTPPDGTGRVPDQRRLEYLRDHLAACEEAVAAGVPLRGYFAWSLLDNFEWAEGYTQRFGITWVDFETQQRVLKDSGLWYADAVRGYRASAIDPA